MLTGSQGSGNGGSVGGEGTAQAEAGLAGGGVGVPGPLQGATGPKVKRILGSKKFLQSEPANEDPAAPLGRSAASTSGRIDPDAPFPDVPRTRPSRLDRGQSPCRRSTGNIVRPPKSMKGKVVLPISQPPPPGEK